MMDEMNPSGGMKMRYTSGCPKNQNRCCQSSTSPPFAGLKKCVPTSRSRISAVLHSMTDGIAKITMNCVTSVAQTKSGMRLSDMPGARSLKIVVIRTIASSRPESSVKVIICAQMSAPLPGA